MKGIKTVAVSASEQLQKIFQQAQQEKSPVYLYRKPGSFGISLDLSKWNEIEVFDVENLMVIVPPGIILKDLNEAAAAKGLRFIPADSPDVASLSVGEWAYRGCPNLLSWKYGSGKHFLLGSSYVFPNGEATAVGGKCIKNVSGYDLTRFLTGAYSDLAVGVQFILKLMPQPAYRRRYDVEFNSLKAVIKLVGALQSRPVAPAWLYWADKSAGTMLFRQNQQEYRVIFELDGNKAEVDDYAADVKSILAACKGKLLDGDTPLPDMSYLETKEEGLWLLDEFKVPYSNVDQFADKVKQAMQEYNWEGGLFGQLADGKINLYLKKADPRINSFIAKLQEEACALGGAVSGKYERLHGAGGNGKLAVLERNFKQRMDPAQIFNRSAEVPE